MGVPSTERRARLRALYAAFGGQCAWCRRPTVMVLHVAGLRQERFEATSDHVQTTSGGGSNKLMNMVLACHERNQERAATPAAHWRDRCELRGWRPLDWWRIVECQERAVKLRDPVR